MLEYKAHKFFFASNAWIIIKKKITFPLKYQEVLQYIPIGKDPMGIRKSPILSLASPLLQIDIAYKNEALCYLYLLIIAQL